MNRKTSALAPAILAVTSSIALALTPFGVGAAPPASGSLAPGQQYTYKYTTHTTGLGPSRDSAATITWTVDTSSANGIMLTRAAKGTMSTSDKWTIRSDGSYQPLSERAPFEAPVPPLTPAANYFGEVPNHPTKGQRWSVSSSTKYLGAGAGDVTITDVADLPGGGTSLTLELRFESVQTSPANVSVKGDLKTVVDATFDNGVLRKWSARARVVISSADSHETPALSRTESGERI